MFLVFLISFAGSTIQNVAGFGFVILCMALFPLLLPIGQCLVAAQFGGALLSLLMLRGKLGGLDLRYVAGPVIFASLSSLLGLLFLRGVDSGAYMVALGVLLIALALWMWKFSARFSITASPLSGGICGALGGLMGAVFGVSVPPLVLYYSANMGESKDGYMAPLQLTLCVQTSVCLLGRAAFRMWPQDVWYLLPPVAVGLLLGKYPGGWIYKRLDVKKFKLVIYLFIALLGVYTAASNL